MKCKKTKFYRCFSFILIFSLFFMTSFLELKRSEIEHKTGMLREMNRVKSAFENLITSRLIAMNGLASFIRVQPNFTQKEFEIYITPIFEGYSDVIRNITFITDTTITQVYPFESNKDALGTDLSKIEAQKGAILYAKESGRSTFSAPVNLVQGGTGIVARIPINKDDRYFAQVAMVFNYDKVIENVGLETLSQGYNIALTSIEPLSNTSKTIWSSGQIYGNQSTSIEISLFDSKLLLTFSTRSIFDYVTGLSIFLVLVGLVFASLFSLLLQKWIEMREALIKNNQELEIRVEKRTEEIMSMNEELVQTLDELQSTHKKLVESEKLASLGSMVIGIAHEVNTPLGVGLTASSYLYDLSDQINDAMKQPELKSHEITRYLDQIKTSMTLILNSFDKASKAIEKFKLISLEGFEEKKTHFNLKQLLADTTGLVQPVLKTNTHFIEIHCPDDLVIYSYKEAFIQIITQLTSNALRYAFDLNTKGNIHINVSKNMNFLEIIFEDDGIGMTPQVLKHIFDPFFTSNKGFKSGLGFGLYLVYNLVVFKLGGTVSCHSSPQNGTRFEIRIKTHELTEDKKETEK